ncbi:hypothetical protein PHLGIDRAFT_43381, partial [Phlebiopsis gigantea 11061_1 CR5-6]
FPTLYAMALDYLAIQASSAPCKRAFSSNAITDSKRCNHFGPMMFKALQILKHWFKKDRIHFMDKWVIDKSEM